MSAEARLKELGLVLPTLAKPAAIICPTGSQATFCISPAKARATRTECR